jgi:hypothetical protein
MRKYNSLYAEKEKTWIAEIATDIRVKRRPGI